MINTSSHTRGMEQEIISGQEPSWFHLLNQMKAKDVVPEGRPLVRVS